jgi:tRNA (cmo5U34)-methyltransferase
MNKWEFNQSVASNFVEYAKRHIPNYDQVIDLSIDVCKKFSQSAKIVEIGCATGETISRLHAAGFSNLYGVDSSQAMLAMCPDLATYICSDVYPSSVSQVDVAIMNWTLHFIKDKDSYLTDIFNNLNSNGILILTDKVSLDPYAIDFYHQFKTMQGVDKQEIIEKEQQIKDVMFINDTEWYLTKLKHLGFEKVFLINAHWCFNTFVCVKGNQ